MNALTTTQQRFSLTPQTFADALKLAEMLANSTMVPRQYQGKAADILVCIQWGVEVGLQPLQALQGIAVINGRPALWGDAALALVRAHPACESISEAVEGDGDQRRGVCSVKRRGQHLQTRSFSVADAKRAKLWNKPGPWQDYPDRMLQLRARGFALRDVFPDALRGVITAEEARDTPDHVVGLAMPEQAMLTGPGSAIEAEERPPPGMENAPRLTARDRLDALQNALDGCVTKGGLELIVSDPATIKIRKWLAEREPEISREVDAKIDRLAARFEFHDELVNEPYQPEESEGEEE